MLQFETGRKVIIRPNPNIKPVIKYERITERDSLGNDISEPEKELTRAPGTKFTLMASPSAKLNGYLATGLHHMVANPFKKQKLKCTPLRSTTHTQVNLSRTQS